MDELHQAEKKRAVLPDIHLHITEKLASVVIEKGWNSDNNPLNSLCSFLFKFLNSENVPLSPCLLRTMLTKAALKKFRANLRTCWSSLPHNFYVLFARDADITDDHFKSSELVSTIVNMIEALKAIGSPATPLSELRRSELMNLCTFWLEMQSRFIKEFVTVPNNFEIYEEGLKQLEETERNVRKVNMIVAWLNNKQFQPPLKEIEIPQDPTQSELNGLAVLPGIDDNSFKHLNFFIPEDSALFKAIFEDKRKEEPDVVSFLNHSDRLVASNLLQLGIDA